MTTNKIKRSEYLKEYQLKNKDKISEYDKKYRQKNKIKILENGKQYYQANKDKISKKHKEYRQKNKIKILENGKQYYQANKDKTLERQKEYHQKNKDKISKRHKEYYQANKDKLSKKHREYDLKSRDKRSQHKKEYKYKRYHTNTEYRLASTIRRGFTRFLKRMRQNKQQRTFDCLNYDMNMLKIRLESTFSPEMNWHNCGTYWHVDHIIPVSYFVCKSKKINDVDKKADLIKECWALSNLQALERIENIKKGDKLPDGSRARYWKE